MQNPKLYTVIYKNAKGESVFFETNDVHSAEKKECITGGQTFIDTRYEAKKRLYNYINRIR